MYLYCSDQCLNSLSFGSARRLPHAQRHVFCFQVLYVFLLYQNVEEGKAHLTSVAHFILTQPLLSFVISEAKSFKALVRDSMDQNGDREGLEQDEGQEDGEEAKRIPTIRVKLHCINPK